MKKILLAPSVQDDEELVDHEATPRMQQRGAPRDFSARGAGNRQLVIYLMKFYSIDQFAKGSQGFDYEVLNWFKNLILANKAVLEVFQFELESLQIVNEEKCRDTLKQ